MTGNDLGILGGLDKLPDLQDIDTFVSKQVFYNQLKELQADKTAFIAAKHKIAHQYIEENKAEEALKILLFNFYKSGFHWLKMRFTTLRNFRMNS